ncbi:MAG: hypothetical protein BMS9Abin02_1718 [Anaerolineae bacterium]|nr:MAG: hypothetical protein BMS9Abin02_1718 [Anaerolineae bacterium]
MDKAVEVIAESVPNQEHANQLMEKLFDAAGSKAVFSEPIESGDYKVITAAEVSVGLGFGYGGGGGYSDDFGEEGDENAPKGIGVGSGGGGGGMTTSRPVAAIEIGPHGVRIEPIVDPTKIALAFFTTLVSMFALMAKMKRAQRKSLR